MSNLVMMSVVFMVLSIVPIIVCHMFRVKREKIDNQDIKKIIDESW